jgi:polyhydroxybutyrate depolymerase
MRARVSTQLPDDTKGMRTLAILTFFCAAFAAAMTSAHAAERQTLPLGNEDRTYRVYRPSSLSWLNAVPLVVVLHGGFGSGLQAENDYHWDAEADAHGFIVAYPDGIDHSWNAGTCCGPAVRQDVDDVRFLTTLIEHLRANQHVDPDRIYVTGMSNGAMMAYRLACESSTHIAAIGSVAGTLAAPCSGAPQTSVMEIHGADDAYVPLHGGISRGFDRTPRRAVSDVIAEWRAIDECEKNIISIEGPVATDTARCAGGRDVTLITVAGAGHQWPGSVAPTQAATMLFHLDPPSRALDATDVLWAFFARHTS